jgi:hypothetical protein
MLFKALSIFCLLCISPMAFASPAGVLSGNLRRSKNRHEGAGESRMLKPASKKNSKNSKNGENEEKTAKASKKDLDNGQTRSQNATISNQTDAPDSPTSPVTTLPPTTPTRPDYCKVCFPTGEGGPTTCLPECCCSGRCEGVCDPFTLICYSLCA